MLPASDRAISRSHCMISYENFFYRPIEDSLLTFLMAYHPRIGRNSLFNHLPSPLFRHILTFLLEKKSLSIVDLGSMCGTYIKVRSTEPVVLEEG
mmetsp:Transcript_32152/g.5817  ORF Transcript_32152/g.5817 Transcript_32152/m.5817 type:complete len:95 (-) Transcript_32152:550-834(-)